MENDLYKKLLNIEKKTPVLLLGLASKVFKDNFSIAEIIKLQSKTDYMNLIDSCIRSPITLVVLDLIYLDPLLNVFLDMYNGILILLAEDTDQINEYLVNIKTIIKLETSTTSLLLGSNQAQKKWKENPDKSNINKFYITDSPELFYLKNKYSLNKYIDLLATDNVS